MNIDTFESYINEQNEWAQEKDCYDIAIFRCWIKFEKFLIDKFVEYSTKPFGSEDIRRLKFDDELHFKAFLKGDRSYIEYMSKIENLSKHIFKNNKNPFDILTSDLNYVKVLKDLIAIRNYIAHESEESEIKYINNIFSGNRKRMMPVNDYLKSWKNQKKTESCYSFYIRSIKEMSQLIERPLFSEDSTGTLT